MGREACLYNQNTCSPVTNLTQWDGLSKKVLLFKTIASCGPRNKIYGLIGGHFTFAKSEEERSRWKNMRTRLSWMGEFLVNKITRLRDGGQNVIPWELKRPRWMRGRVRGRRKQDSRALIWKGVSDIFTWLLEIFRVEAKKKELENHPLGWVFLVHYKNKQRNP